MGRSEGLEAWNPDVKAGSASRGCCPLVARAIVEGSDLAALHI